MNDNKLETVLEFINFIKMRDIRNEGPLNTTLIENETNYRNRHFKRIFGDYSTYSPIGCAERFRLLQCVNFIEKGNSLKDTAIQFGYTPEGLSNALRKNLNINVEIIRSGEYNLGKSIEINQLWKHVGNYRMEFKIEDFMMFLEALEAEKILISLTSENELNASNNDFDLHLDYSKVWSIIKEIDGQTIKRESIDNLCLVESIILYTLLRKALDAGVSKVQFSESGLISRYFVFGFFFNFENRKVKNENNIFCVENKIREIFAGLQEIEEVMNEKFEIILHASMNKRKVTLEFADAYKEVLRM